MQRLLSPRDVAFDELFYPKLSSSYGRVSECTIDAVFAIGRSLGTGRFEGDCTKTAHFVTPSGHVYQTNQGTRSPEKVCFW